MYQVYLLKNMNPTVLIIEIFESGILSQTIQDVLARLGVEKKNIKEIAAKGVTFINVKLISIKETLQQYRMRRIVVDIAA